MNFLNCCKIIYNHWLKQRRKVGRVISFEGKKIFPHTLPPVKGFLFLNIKGCLEEVLNYILFLDHKTNSIKYYVQFHRLKARMNKKCQELDENEDIIFYQANIKAYVPLVAKQNCFWSTWRFLLIHHIHLKFHFRITITLNGKKKLNSTEACMKHLQRFFVQKDK